jgi:hypothetical protein
MGFFRTFEPQIVVTDQLLKDYYYNVLSENAVYKDAIVCVDTDDMSMKFLLGASVSATKFIQSNSNIVIFTKTDYDEGIQYIKNVCGSNWTPENLSTVDFRKRVYATLFPCLKMTPDNDEEVLRTIKNHLEFVDNHKECYKVENRTFREELTGMLNLVPEATNKQILCALKKDATERAKMLQDLNEAMKPEFQPVDSLPEAVASAVAYIHYLSVDLEATNAKVKELSEIMNKVRDAIYEIHEMVCTE